MKKRYVISTQRQCLTGFLASDSAGVMPAWIAGIQARRMRPGTSMSTWVPAVHAGTTISDGSVYAPHADLMAIVSSPERVFEAEEESDGIMQEE
jgi:hypothetical protein